VSIRIRNVNGTLVALCAARSIEKPGDIYLDDAMHHALAEKFSRDAYGEGDHRALYDTEHAKLAEIEESNNPNRTWWNKQYGGPLVCPSCGGPNNCGMEAGEATCWCSGLPRVSLTRAYAASLPSGRCFCVACLKTLEAK
jgi:hypothetical protein